MAAPTDYFVDPALSSDTGDGTVGTPWGRASAGTVIQWALDTGITRDATNGDRINIKAGTDEVLASAISLSTYGAPAPATPLVFRGYTSTQGDGGVGGVDCNGIGMFALSSVDAIALIDLHIHNGGSSKLINVDNYCSLFNCEVNNTSGVLIDGDVQLVVEGCHLHDGGGIGILPTHSARIIGNYFANGTKDFTKAIDLIGVGSFAGSNIMYLDGASIGIDMTTEGNFAMGNSILSSSGTGSGIITYSYQTQIVGNIIEGFSGAGGQAFEMATSIHQVRYEFNAAYNNTTDYVAPEWIISGGSDNEVTADFSVSPFAKSGANTFANRFIYFSPVAGGNVLAGMPNGQDKGAVQHVIGTTVTPVFHRPKRVM